MADEPPVISKDVEEGEVVYDSRPPDASELLLQQKFAERYAAQGEQLDALARQMITIELAVPALYAALLALLYGDKATLTPNLLVYLTFGLWFLALALTFTALFPRQYAVDTSIQRADPNATTSVLGVEDFFRVVAHHKYWLLVGAALAFMAGIGIALVLLFDGNGIVVPPPTP